MLIVLKTSVKRQVKGMFFHPFLLNQCLNLIKSELNMENIALIARKFYRRMSNNIYNDENKEIFLHEV